MPIGGDEDAVRAALERELARLRGASSPLEALGLDAGADGDPRAVRARFLELTKRFHPNRFARHAPDVLRLANEVFLLIRAAQQQAGATGKPEPGDDGSDSSSTDASTDTGTRTDADADADASSAARREQLSAASRPKLQVDAALARRRRQRSQVLARLENNQAIPVPSATDVADRAKQREEERAERLRSALEQLQRGDAASAREALRGLLADDPADKRVRVYLHYAAGRELEGCGRRADARAEYGRVLALVPGFEPAQKALASLGPDDDDEGQRGRSRGGLLGRWFKK